MLTAERLREVLAYDVETGVFTWKIAIGPRARVGAVAGGLNGRGRSKIQIEKGRFFASRLAWLYVHGVWPAVFVDHANGACNNDRICNLREATRVENAQNEHLPRANNASGFRGIHRQGKRWHAEITYAGKRKYLGTFNTPELASEFYTLAKSMVHPFDSRFACPTP